MQSKGIHKTPLNLIILNKNNMNTPTPSNREFLYLCESLESLGYTLVHSVMQQRPSFGKEWKAVYSNGKQVIKLEVKAEDR